MQTMLIRGAKKRVKRNGKLSKFVQWEKVHKAVYVTLILMDESHKKKLFVVSNLCFIFLVEFI